MRNLAIISFLCLALVQKAEANPKPEIRVDPGIYVLVSFSMNVSALRRYFVDAQNHGAKLVMRGFAGQSNTSNRFAETKAKVEKAQINMDINPSLFDKLDIKHVPVIISVDKIGNIKKVSGHITLQKALEIMEQD